MGTFARDAAVANETVAADAALDAWMAARDLGRESSQRQDTGFHDHDGSRGAVATRPGVSQTGSGLATSLHV